MFKATPVRRFKTPFLQPAPFIATPEQQVIGQYFLTGENLCINAFAGTGKALRNDQPVMTPFGYKPISELSVNDLVIGSDGNAYPVTGVYPQGVRSLYDIEFSDKTHVIADADHRWKVYRSDHRLRDGGDNFLIKTTSELAEKTCTMAGKKAKSRDGTRSYWFMPMTKPVNFFINNESLFDGLPIDPWLVGVLLGDGGIGGKSVILSTADDQILFAVRDIIAQTGMIANKAGKYDYRLTCIHKVMPGHRGLFNPLSKALDQLKIRGLRSHEKFIPPSYIFSSVEDRLAVLQGLFDTDGSVSGSAVEYTTTSKQMANEVQFIVHSLGGTATISEKPTRCKLSYRLYIKLPAQFIPFRLKRKVQSMKPAQRPPFRAIRSITPVEPAEATCISVGSPDHLFLTDGCIPTHNTATLVYLAHLGDGPGEMWCFNKRNAVESTERFPKEKTLCTTGHSRAYRAMAMGQHPKRSTLNETWPNWKIVREFAIEGVSGISKEQVAYAAMSGLHRFFYSADPEMTLRHCWDSDYPLEWFVRHLNKEYAKTHSYDAPEFTQQWIQTTLPILAAAWHADYIRIVYGYAQQFLEAMWAVDNPFPLQHDAYLKAWQLRQPVLTDIKYLMIDEFQDWHPCMTNIISLQKCQVIVVGDPQQAIYGFRGAVNAMKNFLARVCYLTQNYRSGIAIVDVGNAILQGVYPGLPLMKGHPQIESSIGPVDRSQPYAVLSRTNAALFEGAINATHQRQPLHVVGKLKDAIHRAESVYGVYAGDRNKVTHPEIRPFEDWETVLQESNYNADLGRYVQLVQEYDKELPVICEKLKQAGEVPLEKAQVILSTAHKFKGLQHDQVVIANDSTRIQAEADEDGPIRFTGPDEEWNLKYIQVTRAVHRLELDSVTHAATGWRYL